MFNYKIQQKNILTNFFIICSISPKLYRRKWSLKLKLWFWSTSVLIDMHINTESINLPTSKIMKFNIFALYPNLIFLLPWKSCKCKPTWKVRDVLKCRRFTSAVLPHWATIYIYTVNKSVQRYRIKYIMRSQLKMHRFPGYILWPQ